MGCTQLGDDRNHQSDEKLLHLRARGNRIPRQQQGQRGKTLPSDGKIHEEDD